jgi:hypothetical protein
MARRTLCPICQRPRDAAPDAAAAELPDEFATRTDLVIGYDLLVTRYGIPCVRCIDRATRAYRERGPLAALQYLAAAAVSSRALQRGTRARTRSALRGKVTR